MKNIKSIVITSASNFISYHVVQKKLVSRYEKVEGPYEKLAGPCEKLQVPREIEDLWLASQITVFGTSEF